MVKSIGLRGVFFGSGQFYVCNDLGVLKSYILQIKFFLKFKKHNRYLYLTISMFYRASRVRVLAFLDSQILVFELLWF